MVVGGWFEIFDIRYGSLTLPQIIKHWIMSVRLLFRLCVAKSRRGRLIGLISDVRQHDVPAIFFLFNARARGRRRAHDRHTLE